MRDEAGKILKPLAQGRQCQRKNINTVKQIAAEAVLLHEVFQVAVRGDHHTHVHFDGLVAANALDFAFFQHAQ